MTSNRPDDRPSFQFYPKDWLGEIALRSLPLSDRGLWIDMLCYMWRSEKRGFLQANGSRVQAEALARMTGTPEAEVKQSLSRMEAAGLYSTTDDGVIYSRRMVRDEKQRLSKVEAGRKGGSVRKAKQTPSKSQAKRGSPSPSPSPSPTAKPLKPFCSEPDKQASEPAVMELELIPRDGKYPITQALIDEYAETYPGVDVPACLRIACQWARDNPSKRKTRRGARRFLGAWLARQQNRGGNKGRSSPDVIEALRNAPVQGEKQDNSLEELKSRW